MNKGVGVLWVAPRKLSLGAAEHMPGLDAELLLQVQARERALRKTVQALKRRQQQWDEANTHKHRGGSAAPRRAALPKELRPQRSKKLPAFGGGRTSADAVRTKAYAGRGGDGRSAFARGPNLRVAPASGGDAGRGGSVVAEADPRVTR